MESKATTKKYNNNQQIRNCGETTPFYVLFTFSFYTCLRCCAESMDFTTPFRFPSASCDLENINPLNIKATRPNKTTLSKFSFFPLM